MFTAAIASPQNLRALLADLQTAPIPTHERASTTKVKPFVTISRVPGIDTAGLAHLLARKLSDASPGEPAWTVWDREVLEKVAEDHHLSREVMESLEESTQSWLIDLFTSMPGHDAPPDRDAIFRSIAHAVNALAQVGRTIIIGYAGVQLTHRLPGGVHILPVAPRQDRVAQLAASEQISIDRAAIRLGELDDHLAAFFKRYFPDDSPGPDCFTLAVNTSTIRPELAVDLISSLVLRSDAAART